MKMTEKQARKLGNATKVIPWQGKQTFHFTWPPTSNNLYANNPRTGGRFMTKNGKDYYIQVARKVEEQRAKSYGDIRLKVWIMCHEPASAERIRDIQNTDKVILDAMGSAGLYFDDSQIDWILIERGARSEFNKGEVVVSIEPLHKGE